MSKILKPFGRVVMSAKIEVDDKGTVQISGLKNQIQMHPAKGAQIVTSALNPMEVTALLAQAVSGTLASILAGKQQKEGGSDGTTENSNDANGDNRERGGIVSGEPN